MYGHFLCDYQTCSLERILYALFCVSFSHAYLLSVCNFYIAGFRDYDLFFMMDYLLSFILWYFLIFEITVTEFHVFTPVHIYHVAPPSSLHLLFFMHGWAHLIDSWIGISRVSVRPLEHRLYKKLINIFSHFRLCYLSFAYPL